MKALRIALWVMVAVFSGVAAYGYLTIGNKPSVIEASSVKIGGPFNLVDHRGEAITQTAFEGRDHAIFFGFTHCPDICPTTLYEVAGWLDKLGDEGDDIDFYFFTVDPERDTPQVMADYVNAFDARITGVTGDTDAMMETVASYKGYAKRVDLDDGDYTMDHSAFVMLFDETGDFKGTISYGENPDVALQKLRRLTQDG
ncbi:MAG: SCO family protein [Pseudomonadota bacterium]